MAVLPIVGHIEARAHGLHVDGPVRDGDSEHVFLPVVAEVDGPLEGDGVLGDALGEQVPAASLLQPGEGGVEHLQAR